MGNGDGGRTVLGVKQSAGMSSARRLYGSLFGAMILVVILGLPLAAQEADVYISPRGSPEHGIIIELGQSQAFEKECTDEQPHNLHWSGETLAIPNWNGDTFTPAAAGEYRPKAICNPEGGHDLHSDSVCLTAVKLLNVTVESNATQTNVTGAKNWAAVKATGEYVILKANVYPAVPEEHMAGLITWSNGDPVEGQPLHRKVSKSTAAKTTVTATCGGVQDYVDVWIIWSTVEFRTGKDKEKTPWISPSNIGNDRSFASGHGGNTLGALCDEVDLVEVHIVDKMEGLVQLQPTGVHQVVTGGWDIKRWVTYRLGQNGTLGDTVSRSDDMTNDDEDLTPDSNDQIFVIDEPRIFGSINHTFERYESFTEYVHWNTQLASPVVPWHIVCWLDEDDHPNDTDRNEIDGGTLSMPAAAHYEPR